MLSCVRYYCLKKVGDRRFDHIRIIKESFNVTGISLEHGMEATKNILHQYTS